MKKILAFAAAILMLVAIAALPAGAKSYQTYTYSYDGFAMYSPDVYCGEKSVDSSIITGLKTALKDPTDIEIDNEYNVYIADAGNNRIVVLDKYYTYKYEISEFYNDNEIPDKLTNPKGVFITPTRIFVCDTDNNRIVTFTKETGEFIEIIPAPESELFEEGSVYKPVAVAVDEFNRLFVVSSTTYQGIIVMTDKGEFTGFIGAQKAQLSAWDILWRRFQTEEQRQQSMAVVSTEFNNITITNEGFIYVTTDSIKAASQMSAMSKRDKGGDYHPVKMLNAAGEEIMRRNGFWPPAGEVSVMTRTTDSNAPTGASKIVDVAVGPEKTWSIIDNKRQKIYTYDFDGNLLFIFGDSGSLLGDIGDITGIVYQGDKMLVLDKMKSSFTVYKRTEYGDILISALEHQNNRQFDLAVDDWTKILQRNSNFDAAYIGIGQSLYRSGQYESSIEYFEAARDIDNWSNSYKEIRKEWISKWVILIPIGVIAICVAWTFFMKYCKKVNTRAAVAGGKRNFKEELLYGFYVIFHPFDGFWDLKHEKRGSLRASICFILLTILAYYYQAIGSGYIINSQGMYTTIIDQAIGVILPFFLWAIANWCLTTLFEGEGSFKDIIIALGYSLLPMVMVLIPTTIASNFIISSELGILNFVVSLGYVWSGILIFLGMMVTHDYSMGKNILTTLGTLIGMIFIMFIGILFTTLLSKITGFVSNIITEINYRM